MKHRIKEKQFNSRMCFVCGLENEMGLKGQFYETEKKEAIGIFQPRKEHQGFPNLLHGGISAAILDEIMARAIFASTEHKIWTVTIEVAIRYRKQVQLGEDIKCVGRMIKRGHRFFTCTGEIYLQNGKVAVSATGKFLEVPLGKIADDGGMSSELIYQSDDLVLTEVET